MGVALPALGNGGTQRPLMFRSGRIDSRDVHDGVAPEPLIIFMKMLVREAREQTAWARRHLHDLTVIWQFDSAVGVRYAANYESAAWLGLDSPYVISLTRPREAGPASASRDGSVEVIALDEGLLGRRVVRVSAAAGRAPARADPARRDVRAEQTAPSRSRL